MKPRLRICGSECGGWILTTRTGEAHLPDLSTAWWFLERWYRATAYIDSICGDPIVRPADLLRMRLH